MHGLFHWVERDPVRSAFLCNSDWHFLAAVNGIDAGIVFELRATIQIVCVDDCHEACLMDCAGHPRQINARSVGARTSEGPEEWGPQKGGARRAAQNIVFFSCPAEHCAPFFLLWGSSRVIVGGVFEAPGHSKTHVWSSLSHLVELLTN